MVIDEAYIDFSTETSWSSKLVDYPNLIVCQTLSKAWGMAGIRLGIGMASPEVVGYLNRIKPPDNVNGLSQDKALDLLKNEDSYKDQVDCIIKERKKLSVFLDGLTFVKEVFPSDANFLLVRVDDARGLYDFLLKEEIIIRDRSKIESLEGCVRISIGTSKENEILKGALSKFDLKK